MPSVNQTNKRRINALERIDSVLGTDINRIPSRDANVKIMKQLEALASHIEQLGTASAEVPQRYLDAEQLARSGATKAEIVDTLLGDN